MQILLSYSLQGMLESRLSLHDRRACWIDDDIKFQLEKVVIANAFSRGLTEAEEILINKRFFLLLHEWRQVPGCKKQYLDTKRDKQRQTPSKLRKGVWPKVRAKVFLLL